MKCMAIPANLSWEKWRDLAKRQLAQIDLLAAYDDLMFPKMFRERLTVNQAVSLAVEAYDDTEDKHDG